MTDPGPEPEGKKPLLDVRQLVNGGVIFIFGALFAAFLGVGPSITFPWQRDDIPPLTQFSDFVPEDWRVVQKVAVDLDGRAPKEIAIQVSAPPDGRTGLAHGDIVLLAWDHEANRWTEVFAASAERSRSYPDRGDGLFDDFREPLDAQLLAIQRGDSADLAFSANLASGAGTPGQVVGVVTFNGDLAELAYSFEGFGSGRIDVVEDAGSFDRLRVESNYYTGIDPHCCPVRNYVVELAPRGDDEYRYYEAVTDDRPWTGAYVAHDSSEVVVTFVAKDSPADGLLEPADRIVGIDGTRLGPPVNAVIDEISAHSPGDRVSLLVDRRGTLETVNLVLGSRLDEFQLHVVPAAPPDMGWVLDTLNGEVVVRFATGPGSPSAAAGIASDDVIEAFDGNTPSSGAHLTYMLSFWGLRDVPLRVRSAGGTTRDVVVKPAEWDTLDPIVPLMDSVTHL